MANLDWITRQIAVGCAPSDCLLNALPDLGISSIVDMRIEAEHNSDKLIRLGLRYLRLPSDDGHFPSLNNLENGIAWIKTELEQGHKVLVHCRYGQGRSVVMVAAFLIRHGMSWQNALSLIKSLHPDTSPTEEHIAGLMFFQ